MFVQIMEGKAADAEAIERLMWQWRDELGPGAPGFLGSTGGITDDGRAVLLARFQSEESARANSDRPEQGQWWSEMEKAFDGPVEFSESTDIDLLRSGGSDVAGFVQVMKDRSADRDGLRELDDKLERVGDDFRPDLLGGLRAWTGTSSYVEFAYFTSEADAREGEQSEPPAALADDMERFGELMAGVEYLDLRDPILFSG